MKIYLEKVQAVEGGLPPAKDKVPGVYQGDNYSIPLNYNLEGDLIGKIEVGGSVIVARTKRMGVEADGYFQSSRVIEVGDGWFKTKNSVYKWNKL